MAEDEGCFCGELEDLHKPLLRERLVEALKIVGAGAFIVIVVMLASIGALSLFLSVMMS